MSVVFVIQKSGLAGEWVGVVTIHLLFESSPPAVNESRYYGGSTRGR